MGIEEEVKMPEAATRDRARQKPAMEIGVPCEGGGDLHIYEVGPPTLDGVRISVDEALGYLKAREDELDEERNMIVGARNILSKITE
jgi:hypothetical protein